AEFEVVDLGVFDYVGQDPNSGYSIYEAEHDLLSIYDPNWIETPDGFEYFCLKLVKLNTANFKGGVHIRIIIFPGTQDEQKLEYDSPWIISTLMNQIGTNASSVTYLSTIATHDDPAQPLLGRLLLTSLACNTVSGPSSEYNEQNFILHGKLIIDKNYCFYGKIYMDDGATIQVNPGYTCNIGWYDQNLGSLLRTTIDACGKMWKMIDVEQFGILNITNTDINDALYGTYLKNRATVNTNHSVVYNNNYIGIYNDLEDSKSIANLNSTYFNYTSPFKENCSNCLGLRLFDRTLAGVYLGKSQISGNSIYAENLLNGIITYNSTLKLNDGHFNGIRDYGTPDNGNPNGKAINTIGYANTSLVENSQFDNCNWAIYSKGVNCEVNYSNMYNVLTGIQFDYSPGRSFKVFHNDIEAENIGINFCWTGEVNTVSVTENDISLLGSNAIGIEINHTNGTSLKIITDNDIYLGPGKIGIEHLASKGTTIAYNSVFSNSTNAIENVGIGIFGGSDAYALCNYLSSSIVCANKGLLVSQSANNLCLGNAADDWYYDYQYIGTNSGTLFGSNVMDNANHGLCLGIPNIGPLGGALIGVQEHTGNKWTGSFAGKAAKHYGNSQDRDKSRFIINALDQQHPEYKPINFLELANDGWFTNDNQNASLLSCPNGVGSSDHPRIFPRSEDYLIASNGFDYGNDAGSRIWTSQRQLYREIAKQDEFSNLPMVYQNFYNSQTETSVGQFENVELLIDSASLITISLQQALDSINAVSDSFSVEIFELLDSLLIQTDSLVKLQLQAEIFEIQSEFDTLEISKNYLKLQLQNAIYTILIQALQLNAEITIDTIYEQNQQLVNETYLNMLLDDDWEIDSLDQQIVNDIASQFALLGGDAVYRARAILKLFNQSGFNDDSICSQAMQQYGSKKIQEMDEIEVFVQPNPSSKSVNVQLDKAEAVIEKIILKDGTGKILQRIQNELRSNYLEISILDLNPGIYFLEFKFNNGKILNKKIVKI
ncbi:MAG: T9SS type A sorting domain-containing protein, partial [Saprospiraceae bacterium]